MRRWLCALVLLAANTDGLEAAPDSCEFGLVETKDGPGIDNPALAAIALDKTKLSCTPQVTKVGPTKYVTFKETECLANELLKGGKAKIDLVAVAQKAPAAIGQCKWSPRTKESPPRLTVTLSAKHIPAIAPDDPAIHAYWNGTTWKWPLLGEAKTEISNFLDGHRGKAVLILAGGSVALVQVPETARQKVATTAAPCRTEPVYTEQPVVHVVNDGRGVTHTYTTRERVLDWCPTAPSADLVCIDVQCGNMDIVYSPPRNVLGQNRGLVVRVRHDPSIAVDVSWAGKRGMESLGMAGLDKVGIDKAVRQAAVAPPTSLVVSSFPFSPRLPGQADLTIQTKRKGKVVRTQTLEMEVEQLTWGAARFGFAALFGDVVSKGYKAQSFAGSSQLEIMQTNDARLGWEAVLGFAPYLIDIFQCPGHGRSHTGGCNWYVSPYVGIGVVGQAATGVDSFKSLYLGAEVEFAPSFSLAATAVWRSVDTLLPGYVVGSPVQPETQFSQSTTGFGFGLVVNVSPDFLQFGTKTDPKPPSPDPAPPQETDAGASDDASEPVPPDADAGAAGGAGGSGGTGGAAGHAARGGAGGAAGHAAGGGGAGGFAGTGAGGAGGQAGRAP